MTRQAPGASAPADDMSSRPNARQLRQWHEQAAHRPHGATSPYSHAVDKDTDPKKLIVTADILLPGRGDPIHNAAVVVEGSVFTHVGPVDDVLAELSARFGSWSDALDSFTKAHVKTLMPGMWDCHVHLMGIHKVTSADIVQSHLSPILTGARSARDVMLLLDAGFTSVREMGGYGIQLDQAIAEGSLVGPKIYSANCIISQTGGHADAHDMPLDWFHDAVDHGLPCYTADGVAECVKAVRVQLRAGAKVIKICGSGGVGSERDNPVDQQFRDDEIAAIVEEAERAQRVVGAHCHGKKGIMASLKNGVKTIEHGSYIDEEAAKLMKDKGAMLVATRLIIEDGLRLGKGMFSPIGYEKLLVTGKAHWKAYQLAIKYGVKCALGTDTGVSIPGSISQGRNALELVYALKAGMDPLSAIEMATANGPDTLGPQAPKSGQIKTGYDADFIGVDGDVLSDISILTHTENVKYVWRAGVNYKAPE
ncbi:amidohydrolase-like protein 2 [Elsinoe australis]|uniref:Amidohydrolase-like protein 2 n=1 Tax=Elsinoe australis TaxID=40998 RepID=A0A4U7AXX9_9PEZI|nr:amidohydrolase-like protein 2 [Elsinoe australis]